MATVTGDRTVAVGERGAPARTRYPEIVLGVAIAVWAVTFSVLVYLKHARFASVDFDMGIHDQSIWLLAHFRGFMTVRGLQVFGHHATPGYFLFVPFYWLGAGPHFLNITQVVVAGLGAVPVFLLARHRTGRPWIGTALGVAFLLHPALQYFMSELFHPEVIAITPLLCAYYCSVRRRWGWFACFAVLAVCWKEDVALAVVLLGLVVTVRGVRSKDPTRRTEIKVGLVTMGAALAWFVLWIAALFPILNGGRVQNEGLYADVGGSPGGVLRTALTHPSRVTSRVLSRDGSTYAWKLFAPFGLAAVAAPFTLLIGAPQAVLNLITNVPWTKTITFHYAALPFTAVTIASVEGVAFLARRIPWRDAADVIAAVVLVCAVVATVTSGPSPIGDRFRDGEWALDASAQLAGARGAVGRIPDGAVVSATYNLLPHLTHRPEIYSFPNPWRSQNFGIDGEPHRSGRRVQWLAVDRDVFDEPTRQLYESLVANGEFEVVYRAGTYEVARRVHG
ncbi:MAG TPA: DUF2079 domain-containing protein [Acidimicrobiia bacterium]